IGNRVHSEPKSARHGGRHSTIVRCRSATSASTRTSSRTCSGTRPRHHRCTRATSVSGRPDTPASLPPRSHPRCDVHWNPPGHKRWPTPCSVDNVPRRTPSSHRPKGHPAALPADHHHPKQNGPGTATNASALLDGEHHPYDREPTSEATTPA